MNIITGTTAKGIPFAKFGNGSETILIPNGDPDFMHTEPTKGLIKLVAKPFAPMLDDYNFHFVKRKPNLPENYTIEQIASDYAEYIEDEIGTDGIVLGNSSGGSYSQHLALHHKNLVKKLILVATAYKLGPKGRALHKQVGEIALKGKWNKAYATLIAGAYDRGLSKYVYKTMMNLFGTNFLGKPESASDGIVEVYAEDAHNIKDQLNEISMPTLLIGGDRDYFYPIELFKETAEGIPNCELIIYPNAGHMVSDSKQFASDILNFISNN